MGHALTIAHFGVVHRVGCQHVEEGLLSAVVPLTEHFIVAVGPVHVEVDLSNVRSGYSTQSILLSFYITIKEPNMRFYFASTQPTAISAESDINLLV